MGWIWVNELSQKISPYMLTSNFMVLRSHNSRVPCFDASIFFDTDDLFSTVAEQTNDIPEGLVANDTILNNLSLNVSSPYGSQTFQI